ncbi:MAG: hypothetical protein U0835_02600 [Isosphaeraceae bacterium]
MPRLRFTIGRLMGIPLILGGVLGLLESMGSPRGDALRVAVVMTAGPILLLLATRDWHELVAAYVAIGGGVFCLVWVMANSEPFAAIAVIIPSIWVSVLLFRYVNRRPPPPAQQEDPSPPGPS